jgi:hypothetical protein
MPEMLDRKSPLQIRKVRLDLIVSSENVLLCLLKFREKSPLHSHSNGAEALSSQARDSPRDNIPAENHELLSPESALSQGLIKHVVADNSKRVQWPNILSRLREAFSLDPQAASEEREMVAMQAVRT